MKPALLEKIRIGLRVRMDRLAKAAFDSHAAATDPGSKAEGKYDTRSLEASYLAAGQGRQVAELADAVRIFEALHLPDFGMEDRIDAGALVEVDLAGASTWFLLVPVAGGVSVTHAGREVTLLTPASGLYQKLRGLQVGDTLDEPELMVTEIG